MLLKNSFIIPLNTELRAQHLELDVDVANSKVGSWLQRVVHQRIHGMTLEQPSVRFAEEVKYLQPISAVLNQSILQSNTLNIRIVPPLESINLQHPIIKVYEALLGGKHVTA